MYHISDVILDSTRLDEALVSCMPIPHFRNFALLHEDCLHAGFCKTCANNLLELEANCPICRSEISVVFKVFQ